MERGRGGKELGAWLGRMCIKGPNPLHRQLFLRGGTVEPVAQQPASFSI